MKIKSSIWQGLSYFLYLHLMKRQIFIILLLAISTGLYAQESNVVQSMPIAQKRDTVRMPTVIKEWKLSSDFTEEVNLPFDTVFSLSNRFKIADKFSPVNASLGNYGLPFYQLNFFDRITDPDKFLYAYYYPFMFVPEKATFMTTQVPFSELVWSFAGPRETAEQTVRFRHSQNVNRFLNFGVIYDIVYSLGKYNYQRSEDKDFTIFSSYTGDKYKVYFSAGINSIITHENGGLKDSAQLIPSNTRDIQVRLGALDLATSTLKNKNLLLIQRYTIGGTTVSKSDSVPKKRSGFLGLSGTFSHILTIESNKRSYSDQYPSSGFYDTSFISKPVSVDPKSVTFDSLYSRSIENTVRFDFTTNETREFRLGGGIGIRNEIFRYSQIVPTHDTVSVADTSVSNRSSNAVVGKLYNNIGEKFRWIATGELYLTGYRAGDFNLNGEIAKFFDWKKGRASWLITGSLSNRQPSFWYQHWGSDHFEWNTNLNKEFRANVGTSFSYPARKAEIKFNYTIIKNYTDFDLTAHPSQYTGNLSVAGVTVSKDLSIWKLHLAPDVIIQKSSNTNVLDLPLVTVRAAAYIEYFFRFKQTGGRLNTQLGVDVTYNSLYHPYAYMPATGRFYRQDLVTVGDYPFMNVFVNLKVKRTRIFVMFDHINAGIYGNKFNMVPLYPMNIRMLRYGIAWTFYD